jgi:hypothetical protein
MALQGAHDPDFQRSATSLGRALGFNLRTPWICCQCCEGRAPLFLGYRGRTKRSGTWLEGAQSVADTRASYTPRLQCNQAVGEWKVNIEVY